MGRLIDADAFIEDIKTEIVNLALDGLKGTPRPREELYRIIDRINEQPTAYDMEKVVDYTHDIIYNILEKVLEPLPDGSEYTEEAYRLLYLNTRISDAIRDGGKE